MTEPKDKLSGKQLAVIETLADEGSQASEKAAIEPPIDTPTAAKILEVIAKARRKTR